MQLLSNLRALTNVVTVSKGYGFTIPPHKTVHDVAKAVSEHANTINIAHKMLSEEFLEHYERGIKPVLNTFLEYVQHIRTPANMSVDREWRPVQHEMLLALLEVFSRGYTRPVIEGPTGSGKSLVLGAIARAYIETIRSLGLSQQVLILTSRTNLITQLLYEEEEKPDDENDGAGLDIGELRLWLNGISDSQIQMLVSGNLSAKEYRNELAKDPLITIMTYHGFNDTALSEYLQKPIGLILLDECHNITERVANLLNKTTAFCVGLSATVQGPLKRSPYFFFDPVIPEEEKNADVDRINYKKYLAYHKSTVELIKEGHLKPVRWIEAKSKIDISGAESLNGGTHTIFNEASISQIIGKNPRVGFEVLREVYLSDHNLLQSLGSKPIIERKGIVYTVSVADAQYYTDMCNQELLPDIHAKYGDKTHFCASYVDGTMDVDTFNERMKRFKDGDINLLFNCKKLGEGLHTPGTNLIIFLRPYGLGSEWQLKQALGRGMSLDGIIDEDLLIVDGVFQSRRHNLASVLGIFGQYRIFNGGLIAAPETHYLLEQKILTMRFLGMSWEKILRSLTRDELLKVPFLVKALQNTPTNYGEGKHSGNDFVYSHIEVSFVEKKEVRHTIALNNPEEMLKLAVEELQERGYTVSRLKYISDERSVFEGFLRRPLGTFRSGKYLIQSVMGAAADSINSSLMKKFADKLGQAGLLQEKVPEQTDRRETIHPRIESTKQHIPSREDKDNITIRKETIEGDPIGKVITFALNHFGVVPLIEVIPRLQFGQPDCFAGQASLDFMGNQFQTDVVYARTVMSARKVAAEQLLEILRAYTAGGETNLFYDSKVFKQRLDALATLTKRYKLVINYEQNQVAEYAEVIASTTMLSHTIKSRPVVHVSYKKARRFACVDLYDQLSVMVSPSDIHTSHDDYPLSGEKLSSNEAIERAKEVFGSESGFYKAGLQGNALVLYFGVPPIAERDYKDQILQFAQDIGRTVVVSPKYHGTHLAKAVESLLPPEWPLRKPTKIEMGKNKRVVVYVDIDQPDTESCKEKIHGFCQLTDIDIVIEGKEKVVFGSESINLGGDRMEREKVCDYIRSHFQHATHKVFNVSFTGVVSVEVNFMSPEIGKRYQLDLTHLTEKTGWHVFFKKNPNQYAMQELAKTLLAEWGVKGFPSVLVQEQQVKVKITQPIDSQVLEKLNQEFLEQTGYTLIVQV